MGEAKHGADTLDARRAHDDVGRKDQVLGLVVRVGLDPFGIDEYRVRADLGAQGLDVPRLDAGERRRLVR